jgi:hypothetical protein
MNELAYNIGWAVIGLGFIAAISLAYMVIATCVKGIREALSHRWYQRWSKRQRELREAGKPYETSTHDPIMHPWWYILDKLRTPK